MLVGKGTHHSGRSSSGRSVSLKSRGEGLLHKWKSSRSVQISSRRIERKSGKESETYDLSISSLDDELVLKHNQIPLSLGVLALLLEGSAKSVEKVSSGGNLLGGEETESSKLGDEEGSELSGLEGLEGGEGSDDGPEDEKKHDGRGGEGEVSDELG